MKRSIDTFFAFDLPREHAGRRTMRHWLPASAVATGVIDPRTWQSRAARGFTWDSHGIGQARPGKTLTPSV